MITSHLLGSLPHGFSEKSDGDGRREEFLLELLKQYPQLTILAKTKQVHGTRVVTLPMNFRKRGIVNLGKADGIVASCTKAILTVVTADCAPVLYADSVSGVVGISHGGWRGTVEGIPTQVLTAMKNLGASISNISVAIGPSIGPCCYAISTDRADIIRKEGGGFALVERAGSWYYSLATHTVMMLLDGGVSHKNIDISPFCTACDEDRFFSYRRDGGIQGEMCSYIGV